MNEHEFELTEEGKREVQYFITECKAKRKEVLDNAGDTITLLPWNLTFFFLKKFLNNVKN